MGKQVTFLNKRRQTTSLLDRISAEFKSTVEGRLFSLFVLSEAIRQGVKLPTKDAEFVAASLRRISEGEDPKAVFGIQRKRGGKDITKSVNRAIGWCCQIAILRKGEGLSVEKAIGQILESPNAPNASADTIWSAWKRYGRFVTVDDSGWAFYWIPEKEK